MSEQTPETDAPEPEFFDGANDSPLPDETVEEFGIRTGRAPTEPPPDPFAE